MMRLLIEGLLTPRRINGQESELNKYLRKDLLDGFCEIYAIQVKYRSVPECLRGVARREGHKAVTS